MSKEQFYDPQQIFSEKDIHFEDIPVFAYKKTVKEQFDSGRFTKEDLLTGLTGEVKSGELTLAKDANNTLTGYAPCYLRESDKALTGKINYTLGTFAPKTLEFSMSAGEKFTRNSSWVLYFYINNNSAGISVGIIGADGCDGTAAAGSSCVCNNDSVKRDLLLTDSC